MERLEQLYEGKAKKVYKTNDPEPKIPENTEHSGTESQKRYEQIQTEVTNPPDSAPRNSFFSLKKGKKERRKTMGKRGIIRSPSEKNGGGQKNNSKKGCL